MTCSGHYEEALQDGSLAACLVVTQELTIDNEWRSGAVRIYKGIGYFIVEYFGSRVCSTHPAECIFIPGPWLETVKAAVPVAEQKIAARQQVEFEKQVERLHKTLLRL